jgi:hypothetical protein
MNAIGNFLSNNGNAIGSLLGTGAQLYGQQNAGQAISSAATAGIGQANKTLGNVSNIWQPQQTLGASADAALASSLGLNGQPANYSNFMNMPGYKFAVQQGQQAAERQAAAMGNAGNSGTAAMIGNQVTGTAMQDYNNYINQVYQGAQLGSTANTSLTGANMGTAGNIEQLGLNSGIAQAGMYTGMGQTVAGGLNGTGVGGVGSAGSGLIGAIGGWLGGNSNASQQPYYNQGYTNPGFNTMGGSTQNPNATGNMNPGFSLSDYGAPSQGNLNSVYSGPSYSDTSLNMSNEAIPSYTAPQIPAY